MQRLWLKLGILIAVAFGLWTPVHAAESVCALSPADRLANATLSYDDFDQIGTQPSSFRALDKAFCFSAAADAAEDYLLHRQGLKDGERVNVLFHAGQARAMAGEERIGAMLIAATRSLQDDPEDPFDWNTYVDGTWAFLVKDRARLQRAAAKLSQSDSPENGVNARVLRGLLACFEKPYREAYGNAQCLSPAAPLQQQ